MINEVECPECGGIGIVEDRRGNEHTCPSCKGKGKLDENLLKKEVGKASEGQDTSGDSSV